MRFDVGQRHDRLSDRLRFQCRGHPHTAIDCCRSAQTYDHAFHRQAARRADELANAERVELSWIAPRLRNQVKSACIRRFHDGAITTHEDARGDVVAQRSTYVDSMNFGSGGGKRVDESGPAIRNGLDKERF